ncbi:unnamed protein product [Sphagnum balticum]
MGEDERLKGLIDVIHRRAYYFEGANGENIREEDRTNYAYFLNKEKKEEQIELVNDERKPFVGFVFKLEESRYGQLTYIRVYQGRLRKGEFVWNDKIGKKLKVSRIVRMHANEMQ